MGNWGRGWDVAPICIHRSRQVPVRSSTSSAKLKKKGALTASEPDILAAVDNEEPSGVVDKTTERVSSIEMPSNLPGMNILSHSVEALDRSPSPVGQRGVMASPFKTPSKIPSPKTGGRLK